MTRFDLDSDLARLLGPDAIPDEERSSIMARLLADDEALSQAADAAAVLRDLEAEDGIVVVEESATAGPPRVHVAEPARDPKVVTPPPSTRRTWRRPPARWLALAAVFVGALLVLPPRFGGGDSSADFAASFTDRQAGLPHDWVLPYGTRGSGTAAADNALAARFGALHMQLELAVAARQQDTTQRNKTVELSRRIAAMLDGVTAGGTVSPIYRDIGARDRLPQDSVVQLLTDGREYLSAFVGEDYFALGAWAEAARIAARRHDAAFYRARASRRMLNRAAALPSLDSLTKVSIDSLRTASQTSSEEEWARVEEHATQLLDHLATPTSTDVAGVVIPFVSDPEGLVPVRLARSSLVRRKPGHTSSA